MRQFLVLIFFCFIKIPLSQNLAINDWDIHLNYTNITAMAESNDMVYLGTRSGVFIYNTKDNSITTLSKMDGLSDLNVSSILYSNAYQSLIIGYHNGNIDIVKNNQVINIPYIRTAQILTNKNINHIFLKQNLAYLSCAFGVVVLNIDKYEIKETYYFSNDGTYVEAHQSYIFNSEINAPQDEFLSNKIFVGTNKGLYYADMNNNLLDFESWNNDSRLSFSEDDGNYTSTIENKVVKKVIGYDQSNVLGKQLIITTELDYSKLNTPWLSSTEYNFFEFNATAYLDPYSLSLNLFNVNLGVPGLIVDVDLSSDANKSIIITNDDNSEKVIILNENFNNILSVNTSQIELVPSGTSVNTCMISDKYIENDFIYLGGSDGGLLKAKTYQYTIAMNELISPNGPIGLQAGSINSAGNTLMLAHGGKTSSWNNTFNYQEVSILKNNVWKSSSELITNGAYDVVEVCGNDNQNGHFFIGTWNNGLIELMDDSLVNIYNASNSSLQNISKDDWVRIGGVDFDRNGDLWVTNSQANEPLSKLSDKTWSSFSVPNWPNNSMAGKLVCLENGQKWIQLRNEGIIAVKTDGNNIVSKKIGTNQGLPSQTVNSFIEDNNGVVWVGTSQGLSVFYFPDDIFNSNGSNGEYILIETQDGYVERLFENTEIYDIAVDGGNRKWVATKTNGVFLVSDDGTEQIANFTKENSPLLSNTVYDIDIIGESGTVFFSTENGLCSYRSNASDNDGSFQGVYIYPNPVNRNYRGEIAISGLTDNTNIKITDIAGNIVFETISIGGTGTWNGKNFNGKRVATGVYLFNCTNEGFNESIVKKVLIYN